MNVNQRGMIYVREGLTEALRLDKTAIEQKAGQESRNINQALTAHTSLTITEPCRYAYRIATEGLLG
jgi:hypothetical protein